MGGGVAYNRDPGYGLGSLTSGGGKFGSADWGGSYVAPITNLESKYPSPEMASFVPAVWKNAKLAKFNYTDPIAYSKKYGDFVRSEMAKNFDFGQQLGLRELDTELQGLQHFAPAAAALKRSETAIDNLFNQYMRTSQLDQAMPGARSSLANQKARAEQYASGRLPDSLMDSAMELNTRSRAADAAAAGGFGAKSSVARKASDLMSAEQRLQVAAMGESLLGSNLQMSAALEMAPTEYSDAGNQIRVMPEVGAGRLAAAAYGEANQYATVPVGTALGSEIQQQEYRTSQEQQLNEFNASGAAQTSQFNSSGGLQASTFNAGTANQFALDKFGYQVSYAGAVTGAQQTDLNTRLGITQQQQAMDMYSSALASGQRSQMVSGIMQGMGGLGTMAMASGLLGGGGGGGGGISMPDILSADLGGGGLSGGGVLSGIGLSRTGTDYSPSLTKDLRASNYPSSAAVPGLTSYDSGTAIPANYMPVGGGGNGGPIAAVPMSTVADNVNSFTRATGLSIDPTGENQAEISKSLLAAGNVLNSAGISYAAAPGQQPIGSNDAGNSMYGATSLMKSTKASAGAVTATGAGYGLDELGVMTKDDLNAINQVGVVASSERMHGRLDTLAANQDSKGFVNATLAGLKIGSAKDNIPAAYAAHQLSQVWDRMSPAQKGLALSSLGTQFFKDSSGKPIIEKPVPATTNSAYQPMSVGQAAGLISAGYNAYTLSKSWEAVNDIAAVKSNGATSINDVAGIAKQLGMLGYGTRGASVPGVNAQQLANAGWKAVPALGVGAIRAQLGSTIPAGYIKVSSDQNSILAIPKNNAFTAALPTSGSLVGTAAGMGGASLSARAIYKSWGATPQIDEHKGVAGGSAVLAGITKMSPDEQAALAIASMFRNVEAV